MQTIARGQAASAIFCEKIFYYRRKTLDRGGAYDYNDNRIIDN